MKTVFDQAILGLLHIFWRRDTFAILKFVLRDVFVVLILVVLSPKGGM